MGCGPKTLNLMGSAHTQGTTTAVFSAFTEAISVADYGSFKAAVKAQDISNASDIEWARAVSYSNDGITWEAASSVGSYVSAEGWDYGGGYATLDASYRFARIGLLARDPSGTSDNENVRATMVIDLNPR